MIHETSVLGLFLFLSVYSLLQDLAAVLFYNRTSFLDQEKQQNIPLCLSCFWKEREVAEIVSRAMVALQHAFFFPCAQLTVKEFEES